MRKLWLTIVLILSLGFSTMSVMAQETTEKPEPVIDEAGILSWIEESSLKGKAERLEEAFHMDVAVVTTTVMNGTDAQLAADEIFQNNGYGTGEGKDGILLMVSMYNRTWAITTHGSAIDLFTDFRLDQIGSRITPYLSEEEYYEAFDVYLQDVEFYLDNRAQNEDASLLPDTANAITQEEQDAAGEAPEGEEGISRGTETEQLQPPEAKAEESAEQIERQPSQHPFRNMVTMSVGGGFLIAFFYVGGQKSKMKTVKKEKDASRYMHSNGYEMTGKRDTFLYSKVDKKERPQDDHHHDERMRYYPERGSDHSTTTTHVDKSGERHGGTSGRF